MADAFSAVTAGTRVIGEQEAAFSHQVCGYQRTSTVAVDAARIEPVSVAKFLSVREKNREFCKFKGSSTIGGRKIADVPDG